MAVFSLLPSGRKAVQHSMFCESQLSGIRMAALLQLDSTCKLCVNHALLFVFLAANSMILFLCTTIRSHEITIIPLFDFMSSPVGRLAFPSVSRRFSIWMEFPIPSRGKQSWSAWLNAIWSHCATVGFISSAIPKGKEGF